MAPSARGLRRRRWGSSWLPHEVLYYQNKKAARPNRDEATLRGTTQIPTPQGCRHSTDRNGVVPSPPTARIGVRGAARE